MVNGDGVDGRKGRTDVAIEGPSPSTVTLTSRDETVRANAQNAAKSSSGTRE